ncbi:hypothetical protein [Streptomyces collinus]|nr:hypothetical protein [Streptomyces collinus]
MRVRTLDVSPVIDEHGYALGREVLTKQNRRDFTAGEIPVRQAV